MANDNLTLEKSATEFLATLNTEERKALAAFLNDETALYELKSHLPFGFIQLAADALRNAGLD